MTSNLVRCLAVLPLAFPLGIAGETLAQPAPSFSTTCDEVERKIREINPQPEELVTIEVTGVLLLAEFDGALSYMGMCSPPHPRVLCVTYELGESKVGDRVTITGAYARPGPDFIVLDPCLHHPPATDEGDG
jgi:hypothetical protein